MRFWDKLFIFMTTEISFNFEFYNLFEDALYITHIFKEKFDSIITNISGLRFSTKM